MADADQEDVTREDRDEQLRLAIRSYVSAKAREKELSEKLEQAKGAVKMARAYTEETRLAIADAMGQATDLHVIFGGFVLHIQSGEATEPLRVTAHKALEVPRE